MPSLSTTPSGKFAVASRVHLARSMERKDGRSTVRTLSFEGTPVGRGRLEGGKEGEEDDDEDRCWR